MDIKFASFSSSSALRFGAKDGMMDTSEERKKREKREKREKRDIIRVAVVESLVRIIARIDGSDDINAVRTLITRNRKSNSLPMSTQQRIQNVKESCPSHLSTLYSLPSPLSSHMRVPGFTMRPPTPSKNAIGEVLQEFETPAPPLNLMPAFGADAKMGKIQLSLLSPLYYLLSFTCVL